MKQSLKKMFPMLIVIAVTITMSLVLYQGVMERETDRCWQVLSDSAESLNREICVKLEDNISILKITADIVIETGRTEIESVSELCLNTLYDNTIFSEIDVIYPDNTIVLENGQRRVEDKNNLFEELAKKGEHMSERMQSPDGDQYYVCYYMPVIIDGETKLILAGVIDTETITEIVSSTIYAGRALCIITDSHDGNYIVDEWHKGELGNAFNTPDRKRLKGYEHVNLKEEIRNLQTGVLAFESRTTGRPLYMYYTPVGMFDWQLSVFVTENVIFENQIYLRQMLIFAGIVEIILLFMYFVWNLMNIRALARSKAETEKQLEISHTLIHCVTELSEDKEISISIQNLLQIINEYFDADSTYIFEADSEGEVYVNTYEYVAEGVSPQRKDLQNVPAEQISMLISSFENTQAYYFADVDKETDKFLFAIRKQQNLDRMIAVPLSKDGIVAGFVGVDNPKQHYDDVTLLSSIQFFITNSLASGKQQEQLRYMSFRDALTSLYNRNKYIQMLDFYAGQRLEKVGVAYIDLNGLKRINDEKGHEAGDDYIKTAARLISESYPKECYRIGGDEFVIMQKNVEKDKFFSTIEELKKIMDEEKVSSSVGFLWEESCENLEEFLKQADQEMYMEKQRYYSVCKPYR